MEDEFPSSEKEKEIIHSESWWVISGEDFKAALYKVAEGENPDLVYLEWYANSDHEYPYKES